MKLTEEDLKMIRQVAIDIYKGPHSYGVDAGDLRFDAIAQATADYLKKRLEDRGDTDQQGAG